LGPAYLDRKIQLHGRGLNPSKIGATNKYTSAKQSRTDGLGKRIRIFSQLSRRERGEFTAIRGILMCGSKGKPQEKTGTSRTNHYWNAGSTGKGTQASKAVTSPPNTIRRNTFMEGSTALEN